MNNQVLSIDQCKELTDLGLDMSDANMSYRLTDEGEHIGFEYELTIGYNSNLDDCYPTYTLQDILEKLPKNSLYSNKHVFVSYLLNDDFSIFQEKSGKTSIEAAFNMLKWCIINKYI